MSSQISMTRWSYIPSFPMKTLMLDINSHFGWLNPNWNSACKTRFILFSSIVSFIMTMLSIEIIHDGSPYQSALSPSLRCVNILSHQKSSWIQSKITSGSPGVLFFPNFSPLFPRFPPCFPLRRFVERTAPRPSPRCWRAATVWRRSGQTRRRRSPAAKLKVETNGYYGYTLVITIVLWLSWLLWLSFK